jgi:hypothetical protein
MTSDALLGLGIWLAAFAIICAVLVWVARHHINPVWMRALIRTQSGGAPHAASSSGPLPSTARSKR